MSSLYELLTAGLRAVYDRRLSDPPILDGQRRFPAQERFTASWPELRDEALRVSQDLAHIPRFHELMSEQADISDNDEHDWRMFVVKAYGVEIAPNLARCPQLAALLAETPDVLSATLSFLSPHKHIPEHRGPFRGVLRFYLGLSVPCTETGIPATELVIDDTPYRIGNGECLLWDDTYRHEVRHQSDQPRVALLLDVRRRNLPLDLAILSRLLIVLAGLAVRWRRRGRIDPFVPPRLAAAGVAVMQAGSAPAGR